MESLLSIARMQMLFTIRLILRISILRRCRCGRVAINCSLLTWVMLRIKVLNRWLVGLKILVTNLYGLLTRTLCIMIIRLLSPLMALKMVQWLLIRVVLKRLLTKVVSTVILMLVCLNVMRVVNRRWKFLKVLIIRLLQMVVSRTLIRNIRVIRI